MTFDQLLSGIQSFARDYGVVIATAALVLFTWRLVAATRELSNATDRMTEEETKTRVEARTRRDQDMLRAALIEAAENCRQWLAHEPATNREVALMRSRPLRFVSLSWLLASLDLPSDVATYLLWLKHHLSDNQQRYDAQIEAAGEDRQQASLAARGLWEVELDLLQTSACILRAHALANPTLAAVADTVTAPAWLASRPAPENQRVYEQVSQQAYFGAPAFPQGDAYLACTAASRDRAGQTMLAAQREYLANLEASTARRVGEV